MKKNYKGTVREPNNFVYGSLTKLIGPGLVKKYGLANNYDEIKDQINGPAVLLCTHPSFIDFLFPAKIMYPKKINYVLAYSFYNIKAITKLVYNLGAFPKLQFQNDINAMKNMKKVIDNKGILGIYPVGLVSENGESGDIPLATGRFLKWLNADVFICHTLGGYMMKPKWAKNKRKGNIDLKFSKLISKEDLKNISIDELQHKVEQALYFNEYETMKDRPFVGKGLAEGLENLAYKCPKCGQEFHTSTEGDIIKCSCGNEAKMDEFGHLHKIKDDDVIFDTPYDIYYSERNEIRNLILNDTFKLEDECDLHLTDDLYSPYRFVGKGKLKMVKHHVYYDGKIDNEEVHLDLDTNGLMACAFVYGERFEIQFHNKVYVFYPKNGQSVIKYSMAIREQYKIDFLEDKND